MSTFDDSLRLRATFDAAAERYARARPGYPARLFDDVVQLVGLEPGARVLEIGCGTGQATRPLAERGFRIVAVELGAALAAVARRNLAAFPSVEVVVGAFEAWPLPPEPFDLVLAATAFHWLDPAMRLAKTAAALRPGGCLAIVTTDHVAGGTEPFFVDVQTCYERWDPATPPGLRLQPADEIPTESYAIERSSWFEMPIVRRYTWEQAYTTDSYLDVLLTYSNHLALPSEARAGLLSCIAHLIDVDYAGAIRKRYQNELLIARRRTSPAGAPLEGEPCLSAPG
ncbi:MAG: class I SAM-dependent methyltransferase [Chloroflexi bacterium]|nr:class I SAM-dependent methyltransferase [Chloroflexota bacterium]